MLAVAYIWLVENTYDKEYVAKHTVGFDKFADYVLGKEDNLPKTPEWASKKCGVPEWTIKALARQWASKITSTLHYYGGSYIRGPYSHEPARLEVCLLGMQGLGKPGIHQYNTMGRDYDFPGPKRTERVSTFGWKAFSGHMQMFPRYTAPPSFPNARCTMPSFIRRLLPWAPVVWPLPLKTSSLNMNIRCPKKKAALKYA